MKKKSTLELQLIVAAFISAILVFTMIPALVLAGGMGILAIAITIVSHDTVQCEEEDIKEWESAASEDHQPRSAWKGKAILSIVALLVLFTSCSSELDHPTIIEKIHFHSSTGLTDGIRIKVLDETSFISYVYLDFAEASALRFRDTIFVDLLQHRMDDSGESRTMRAVLLK